MSQRQRWHQSKAPEDTYSQGYWVLMYSFHWKTENLFPCIWMICPSLCLCNMNWTQILIDNGCISSSTPFLSTDLYWNSVYKISSPLSKKIRIFPKVGQQEGFSISALDSGPYNVLLWTASWPCRMFSSILGLNPLAVGCNLLPPQLWQPKNASRYCQVTPEEQNHFLLRTIGL